MRNQANVEGRRIRTANICINLLRTDVATFEAHVDVRRSVMGSKFPRLLESDVTMCHLIRRPSYKYVRWPNEPLAPVLAKRDKVQGLSGTTLQQPHAAIVMYVVRVASALALPSMQRLVPVVVVSFERLV
jgi:hypothetical protein